MGMQDETTLPQAEGPFSTGLQDTCTLAPLGPFEALLHCEKQYKTRIT